MPNRRKTKILRLTSGLIWWFLRMVQDTSVTHGNKWNVICRASMSRFLIASYLKVELESVHSSLNCGSVSCKRPFVPWLAKPGLSPIWKPSGAPSHHGLRRELFSIPWERPKTVRKCTQKVSWPSFDKASGRRVSMNLCKRRSMTTSRWPNCNISQSSYFRDRFANVLCKPWTNSSKCRPL